ARAIAGEPLVRSPHRDPCGGGGGGDRPACIVHPLDQQHSALDGHSCVRMNAHPGESSWALGRRGTDPLPQEPPDEQRAWPTHLGGVRRAPCRRREGSPGGPHAWHEHRPRHRNRFSSRRAITCLCTSSGPSASRSMRPSPPRRAGGGSSAPPRAPCTWMARSSTRMNTLAATTLIIEISCRASFLPTVSIFHAA